MVILHYLSPEDTSYQCCIYCMHIISDATLWSCKTHLHSRVVTSIEKKKLPINYRDGWVGVQLERVCLQSALSKLEAVILIEKMLIIVDRIKIVIQSYLESRSIISFGYLKILQWRLG